MLSSAFRGRQARRNFIPSLKHSEEFCQDSRMLTRTTIEGVTTRLTFRMQMEIIRFKLLRKDGSQRNRLLYQLYGFLKLRFPKLNVRDLAKWIHANDWILSSDIAPRSFIESRYWHELKATFLKRTSNGEKLPNICKGEISPKSGKSPEHSKQLKRIGGRKTRKAHSAQDEALQVEQEEQGSRSRRVPRSPMSQELQQTQQPSEGPMLTYPTRSNGDPPQIIMDIEEILKITDEDILQAFQNFEQHEIDDDELFAYFASL